VLAERGQQFATQWAAVGGRLAVLGPAHGKPAAFEAFGHRSRACHRGAIGPLWCPRVEQRNERIIIETERHRITGRLLLPADGYRSRLTDYLNASEREFLALTDVEVTTLDGSPRIEKRDFIALSVRHIVLAMPADDTGDPIH
jgi:hypothetical protein